MENKRRLHMAAALSKSSEKLSKVCDLGCCTDVLKTGVEVSSHYKNAVELIAE